MNQLTVMLNGNGANNGVHQSQATTNQFFTFTGQPGFGNTMSLDPSQQVNSNVPQLVTFQSQPAQTQGTATMMLSGSQQQYSAQSGGIGHHQQGAIQYFITQPTQQPSQQPQQILTTSTQSQQFGIVQNLLASGMGAMIPVNQPLAGTNGTIQIPTQTLMAQPNGGLQPGSFVTMTNQPSGTIQFSTNPHHQSGTQLFHQQPQFQFQPGPTLGNGAITITNPNQLITTNQPNGQQFIINQNYSPANAQSTNLITTNQASTSQPIYQFVLPNGQVIQTVQPQQNTTTLISPQLQLQTQQTVQQQQQHQHQSTAITVPFQTNQNGPQQLSNFLTPNLTLNSNGTTTFITQPQQTTPNLSNSSILSHHQSPNLTTNQSTGQLLLTSPSSGPNQQQQSIVLTSPQMHHQSGQSLLIPAVSSASGNQASQQQQSSNGNATTAMVVLTQSIQSNLSGTTNNNNSSVTSLMPSAVLDHKSIKSDSFGASQPTLVLLTSPKMKQPATSQHALVTAKLVVNGNTETLSGKQQTINNRGQQVTPSGVVKLSLDPKPPKPAPIDQSTQCDHNPQIQKLLENIAEEDESQCSDKTQEEANSTSNNNTPEPERPSRPSSTSSCGSLKIAEDVEEEEEDEIEQEMDNDTENNDAFSTETELDNNSVNESENSETKNKNSMQCTTTKSSSGNSENCSQTKKVRQQEDKEGYQSSYGSPCHFTDTEDEEEEDLGIMENGEVNDVEEIKLVRKNGLTKAAFDLINNRLQSSDYAEDHATNDSKSSITSGNAAVGGTDPDDDDMSNDSNGTFSLQIQTPSPSGSNASGLMEPESTTHGLKETTISQICQRIHQGIDLDPIREFAKRFKLFRLARGLTQSQVCHDLSLKTDGQSYSQSAICRFEKMDITPKSAIKIKPVLENWMKTSEEKYPKNKLINTELLSSNDLTLMNNMNSMEGGGSVGVLFSHLNTYEGSAGRSSEDESISSLNSISLEPGKKRKKRTSFTPEQLDALNHFFEKNPKPSSEDMTEISRILCSHDPKINRDVVRVWFCNKRQALKAKRPNFMDPPTPPPAIAPNCADTMRTYSKFQPARTATPPPTYSNLKMSISAASSEASKTLLGLGTLTFPYSSAVSAIPLTLSTSGNNNNLHHQQQQVTSATVPNSQQAASLPLNMAVSKSTTNKATSQLTMPINLTQLRPQGHNSTNSATITTFKVEPP